MQGNRDHMFIHCCASLTASTLTTHIQTRDILVSINGVSLLRSGSNQSAFRGAEAFFDFVAQTIKLAKSPKKVRLLRLIGNEEDEENASSEGEPKFEIVLSPAETDLLLNHDVKSEVPRFRVKKLQIRNTFQPSTSSLFDVIFSYEQSLGIRIWPHKLMGSNEIISTSPHSPRSPHHELLVAIGGSQEDGLSILEIEEDSMQLSEEMRLMVDQFPEDLSIDLSADIDHLPGDTVAPISGREVDVYQVPGQSMQPGQSRQSYTSEFSDEGNGNDYFEPISLFQLGKDIDEVKERITEGELREAHKMLSIVTGIETKPSLKDMIPSPETVPVEINLMISPVKEGKNEDLDADRNDLNGYSENENNENYHSELDDDIEVGVYDIQPTSVEVKANLFKSTLSVSTSDKAFYSSPLSITTTEQFTPPSSSPTSPSKMKMKSPFKTIATSFMAVMRIGSRSPPRSPKSATSSPKFQAESSPKSQAESSLQADSSHKYDNALDSELHGSSRLTMDTELHGVKPQGAQSPGGRTLEVNGVEPLGVKPHGAQMGPQTDPKSESWADYKAEAMGDSTGGVSRSGSYNRLGLGAMLSGGMGSTGSPTNKTPDGSNTSPSVSNMGCNMVRYVLTPRPPSGPSGVTMDDINKKKKKDEEEELSVASISSLLAEQHRLERDLEAVREENEYLKSTLESVSIKSAATQATNIGANTANTIGSTEGKGTSEKNQIGGDVGVINGWTEGGSISPIQPGGSEGYVTDGTVTPEREDREETDRELQKTKDELLILQNEYHKLIAINMLEKEEMQLDLSNAREEAEVLAADLLLAQNERDRINDETIASNLKQQQLQDAATKTKTQVLTFIADFDNTTSHANSSDLTVEHFLGGRGLAIAKKRRNDHDVLVTENKKLNDEMAILNRLLDNQEKINSSNGTSNKSERINGPSNGASNVASNGNSNKSERTVERTYGTGHGTPDQTYVSTGQGSDEGHRISYKVNYNNNENKNNELCTVSSSTDEVSMKTDNMKSDSLKTDSNKSDGTRTKMGIIVQRAQGSGQGEDRRISIPVERDLSGNNFRTLDLDSVSPDKKEKKKKSPWGKFKALLKGKKGKEVASI